MKNLLVVDDNPLMLASLTFYLSTFPGVANVYAASSPDEALRLANTYPIDIAILDYLLPEGDGLTLALLLRKQHPKIKIAILSVVDRSKKEPDIAIDAWLVKSANLKPLELFLAQNL